MILPRKSLFHKSTTPPESQSQPQSQTQTPPSSPESWTLPASYRVAIVLNASILLFILAIILSLILYTRNRRPTSYQLHKSRNSLSDEIQDEEEETLLESKDAYSDSDLDLSSASVGTGKGEMSEKKRPGPIRIPLPGTFSPVGILSPSIRTPGTGRKRGHVRWTPSVQGGEAFGILEREDAENEGEKGKGKGKGISGEGKDGSIEGKGKEKKCKCRGRRHPECWRFELHFEDGARPVLGAEREEGMGRPSSSQERCD